MSEVPEDLKKDMKGELQRAYNAIHLVRANGGWKYREGIPLPDGDVVSRGEQAEQYILSAVASLVVARRLIRELGRDAYFEARVDEARLELQRPQIRRA